MTTLRRYHGAFLGGAGLVGTLWATSALAHPSGLPQLKERAAFVLDTAWDWLAWDFHESIVLGVLALIALYTAATTVWRVRYAWSDQPTSIGQRAAFYGGSALLYFTLDGPLHHLADELLFSAHMVQHLLLQLVWAPLLIIGVPLWLWRKLAFHPRLASTARFLSKPTVAFLLYNGCIAGWHFPPAYQTALTVHEWHIVQHLMFMVTAVVMWWVTLAPLPELRVGYFGRMAYLFVNMVAMKALGLTISLSDEVLYPFYEAQPRAWGISVLDDQQLGGMLMWLPGGMLMWLGMGRIFYQWVFVGTPARGSSGSRSLDAERAEVMARGGRRQPVVEASSGTAT